MVLLVVFILFVELVLVVPVTVVFAWIGLKTDLTPSSEALRKRYSLGVPLPDTGE